MTEKLFTGTLNHNQANKQIFLNAKLACHPAMCLLPVKIIERCGLATGPATVELLPYLLPY